MKIKIHSSGKYELLEDFLYISPRYMKHIMIRKGYYDGATGAIDITTKAWWIHDQICNKPFWNDGTPITAWMASRVLYDVLNEEKRYVRKHTWSFFTFAFGCDLAKENGWW